MNFKMMKKDVFRCEFKITCKTARGMLIARMSLKINEKNKGFRTIFAKVSFCMAFFDVLS
jgi:hypothetical protein